MLVIFSQPVSPSRLTAFDTGVAPVFCRKGSTAAGNAKCVCGEYVGDIELCGDKKMSGWLRTRCACGRDINWSKAIVSCLSSIA